MHDTKGADAVRERFLSAGDIGRMITAVFGRLRHYYLLFAVVFALCFSVMLLYYWLNKPAYTAIAVIGPPNPSPGSALLLSANSVGGGLGSRLLGSSGSGYGTPYQQFQQLLISSQLRSELFRDKSVLSRLYEYQWDTKTNNWKAPSSWAMMRVSVKQMLGMRPNLHPTEDSFDAYFARNFYAEPSKSIQSVTFQLTSPDISYIRVLFVADSPEKAEYLLSKTLNVSDNIIRSQQLRDINARIGYIKQQLLSVTLGEQRDSLIRTLSSQEELKVMMVSDKRFSYCLVSAPHASRIPTYPWPVPKTLLWVIVLSLLLWVFLVGVASYSQVVQNAIRRFER